MLSSYPLRDRILIRSALSASWLLVALGGIAAIFYTPATIENELGTYLTYLWGGVSAIAASVAAVGVITDRYRLEWGAAWFAASGLTVYVGVVWWLVLTSSPTRLTQALMVSALVLNSAFRALMCAAHARKLRAEHETDSGAVDVLRN